MAYYVYMLRCGDGSLYTGSTDDVARRLKVHQSGKGAKYTRSRLPVALVYREELPDRSAALRREAAIKKLTRGQKLALLAEKERNQMEMRRKDRQMPEEFAWEVVDRCEYAVVAMTAENGEPYCLPVNVVREGKNIYFHSAMAGRKAESLRLHPRVCLTCVGENQVLPERYTTLYASAVAFGTARELTDDGEKREALRLLCQRYAPDHMDLFNGAMAASLSRTAVWCIAVEEITGKSNRNNHR